MAQWLEQWSKAGAGPGFRVDNPLIYIQNFNWLSRWIETYFLGKVLDQLGILVLVFLITFLLFKNFKIKNERNNVFVINKNVSLLII